MPKQRNSNWTQNRKFSSTMFSFGPPAAASAPVVQPKSELKVATRAFGTPNRPIMVPRSVSAQKVTVGGARKRGQKKGGNYVSMMQPPTFNTDISFKHRFRFALTSTLNQQNVTVNNLINMFGAIATTVTSATSIAIAMRLRRISIWSPSNTAANVTADINWSSTTDSNTRPVNIMNAVLGSAQPAYLTSTPPAKSLASFWWNDLAAGSTFNTVLFNFTAITGSIIDVEAECVLQDLATLGITTVIIAGTAGHLYYGNLVGSGSTAVGLPQLTGFA